MKVNGVLAVGAAIVLFTVGYLVLSSNPAGRSVRPPELKMAKAAHIVEPVASSECPGGAGLIPPSDTLDKLTARELVEIYRDYGSNTEVTCRRQMRMGSMDDGGWEVCDDKHVKPKKDCLVYSFGIANDFSFDDMIGKYYGCEVHAFDPSMEMPDTRRSDRVMFHHLGLYGSNGFIKNKWPVKTLAEIRKLLGHTNRHIDVLKMDIEHSEWPTLETALRDGSLKNISQFLFEIHNTDDSKTSSVSKLKTLKGLRDHGFRAFYAHKNFRCPFGSKTEIPLRTACHEVHTIYIPGCDTSVNKV